jgi:23S rRNA (pseudouridine1915-N3)-methyltransferase
MKLTIYCFGKDHETYVKEGVALFTKRLQHYYKTEWIILPIPKNASVLAVEEYKLKEAEQLQDKLTKDDFIVCLDEFGKNISSPELADLIVKASIYSHKRMVFVIGGAYGIHHNIMQKINFKWSLSKLVFPHQLVRLILAEQLYRACSINNNEKYHH